MEKRISNYNSCIIIDWFRLKFANATIYTVYKKKWYEIIIIRKTYLSCCFLTRCLAVMRAFGPRIDSTMLSCFVFSSSCTSEDIGASASSSLSLSAKRESRRKRSSVPNPDCNSKSWKKKKIGISLRWNYTLFFFFFFTHTVISVLNK